jgi:hypothetical protein
VVAIDGKTSRRSLDKAGGKAAIHMISAWSGVVAWTPAPLIPIAACLLKDAINAAQIQRGSSRQDPEAKASCD